MIFFKRRLAQVKWRTKIKVRISMRRQMIAYWIKNKLNTKRNYKTINIEYPDGWSNCGVSIGNYFIADTNDSSNWDTIKFPLPKPKYEWLIKCYGGTLGRKINKQFVVLIDKPYKK